MATTKTGARAQFLALVEAQGWAPDPAQTVARKRWDSERIQDPHAFTHPAAHGGQWEIKLDYVNDTGYTRGYDDRLRRVEVSYRDADGIKSHDSWQPNAGTLKKPSTYDRHNGLYEALGPGTLRERAQRLVTDPDLAIWLAAESEHADQQAREAKYATERADRLAREQPLPVTVSQGDYNSEWWKLSFALKSAAEAVYGADGTSDLPTLIAATQAALYNVIDVLTVEASVELANHLGLEAQI